MECPDCSDLFVFVSVNENAFAYMYRSTRTLPVHELLHHCKVLEYMYTPTKKKSRSSFS